ncbi:MAG TPA: hypothetical protein VHA11_15645 [Bryobacteraceae bacterium]|nr:hypothetical protein [Bryobacteraceae bacterium]
MPTIRLTDRAGLSLDIRTPPLSTFERNLKQVPQLVAGKLDLAQVGGLSLRDPAIRAFESDLTFDQPVGLGSDSVELTLGAGVQGGFRVIQRDPDHPVLAEGEDFGEEIEIPEESCFLRVHLGASVSAELEGEQGALRLGFSGASSVEIANSVRYSAGDDAPTLVDALRDSLGNFLIPAHAADLERIPNGAVVTVTGTGTLSFSAATNLLAVANPLATASLPAGLPALSIAQTGSVEIGAEFTITGEYQVRARKIGPREVELGWFRRRGQEFAVNVEAGAGIEAGAGKLDLLTRVVSALGASAAADISELQQAGLAEEEAEAIEDAVRSAVNRKLELAASASLSTGKAHEAAFLYRIDAAALDAAGAAAVDAALRGNLSRLSGAPQLPAGIVEIRNLARDIRESRHSLHVNLLGIYNYGSVSRLVREGSVMFTPSTGELVIADRATSETIASAARNLGADEEKLRKLMFGSLMLTAAYQGSRTDVGAPALSSMHLYFIQKVDARRNDLRRYLRTLAALGFEANPDGALPAGVERFGKTALLARTTYDNETARRLFLTSGGSPRAVEEYEDVGRKALATLLLPDADDAFRLRPLRDRALWGRMKVNGPPNRFGGLFGRDLEAEVIRGDYLLIRWWSDAMNAVGLVLSQIQQLFAPGANVALDDPRFEKLRKELAKRLTDVVRKLPAERWSFQVGEPWGLVVLFLASGEAAAAEARLISPLLTRLEERNIQLAAGT